MWYEEMSRSVNQKVVTFLVGNKLDMDLKRVVSTEEGRMLGSFESMQLKSMAFLLSRPRPNLGKILMICSKASWKEFWPMETRNLHPGTNLSLLDSHFHKAETAPRNIVVVVILDFNSK